MKRRKTLTLIALGLFVLATLSLSPIIPPYGQQAEALIIQDGLVTQQQGPTGEVTAQSVTLRAITGKAQAKSDGSIQLLWNPPFPSDNVFVTASPIYEQGPAAFTTICGADRFGACVWVGRYDGVGLPRWISFHAIGPAN